MRLGIVTLAFLAAAAAGSRAGAQLVAAHAVLVPGGEGLRPATGVEIEIGGSVSAGYFALWPSVALEYQRQHDLGPGRARLAGQLRVLPGTTDLRLLPYLGVSGSANQSGGDQSEWHGTLAGLQGMAGFLLIPTDDLPFAFLIEERFGYVRDRNHAFATHIGLMIGL